MLKQLRDENNVVKRFKCVVYDNTDIVHLTYQQKKDANRHPLSMLYVNSKVKSSLKKL